MVKDGLKCTVQTEIRYLRIPGGSGGPGPPERWRPTFLEGLPGSRSRPESSKKSTSLDHRF